MSYELTFRTEEGLPLVDTPYMRLIVESYLARAQQMFPVTITNLVVMGNHVHMLIVVQNPADAPNFVGYFKRETSHAVNRLLGREKRTVWAEGYDSPVVLDAEKVVERLVYFYTNPQRSRIVGRIEEYSQVHSWNSFVNGSQLRKTVPIFPRTAVPKLETDHDPSQDARVYREILSEQNGECELVIEPFAWMNSFPDTEVRSPESFIERVKKLVGAAELLLNITEGEVPPGKNKHVDIQKEHVPEKYGKRTLCLGSVREQRREFIEWCLEDARVAKEAFLRWVRGQAPLVMPPGFFIPGGKLFSNVFPQLLRA